MWAWVLPVVAVAVLPAGCISSGAGGQVFAGSATQLADRVTRVTLTGVFNADDSYVVTGPPNNTVYMDNQKPTDGNLVFTADLPAGVHTFVVRDATLGVSAGEVNVSLP
jgi:hypothetical protein